MLTIIISLFSIFSLQENRGGVHLPDSSKHPRRPKTAIDSTGRFIQINRVFIVGNRITHEPIIMRELTLKEGDFIYSQELPGILDLDKKKLINTRLFNTVEIRTLELEPNRIDLLIDLNERWYTFPSPIFELADRNFNEWWQNYNHDFGRVNYGLRLYQYNMRGRNETLRFLAQFGFTRRFGLSYRFPYIDKKQKHGLTIDLDFSEATNLAYQTVDHKLIFLEAEEILKTTRSGGLTYNYRRSFYQSHSFKFDYKSVSIHDTIAVLNPNYLGDDETQQQFGSLTYQFSSDHRDYGGYPLKGYFLQAAVIKSGITPADDINKLEVNLTFANYFDLKKGFYLSNNTIGYWSTPNNLPYTNYGALGYQKQIVRGYEVYVIEGPQFVLNKTTFKKRILSRTYHWGVMPLPQFRHVPLAIYLKIYGDVGYVNNYNGYEISSRLSNTLLSGVGAGIDVVGSYDAVFRFEYTYNAIGERGFFFHVKKEF